MIIQGSRGLYFLLIKKMHFTLLRNLLKSFKIRKISNIASIRNDNGGEFENIDFELFFMNMELNIIFLRLEPLNKME